MRAIGVSYWCFATLASNSPKSRTSARHYFCIASYILRNFAHVFLPLLYVYGNRKSNIDKAQKAFHAGKWEKLWNRAQSNAAIRKERLATKPRNNAPRSDEQKIEYATTLDWKGNLSKSNSVITKELIPEDGDELAFAGADLQVAMGRYDVWHQFQDPQHVPLFAALHAQPGSLEDNVSRGGGLSFLAGKFRDGSLFDIRDFNLVPPSPTTHSWLTSGPSASSPLCNTSPAMRNCVNVAARSSISTAPALASLALKPRHFVRAAPAGPPSASADPGTGSKALSSHVTFVNFTNPDV